MPRPRAGTGSGQAGELRVCLLVRLEGVEAYGVFGKDCANHFGEIGKFLILIIFGGGGNGLVLDLGQSGSRH